MNFPFDSENLHHAYALVGDQDAIADELVSYIASELRFTTRANPDFWMNRYETFGIDDARELTELHIRKPLAGERKMFVLRANGMTVEAQNALLKLFEEPIAGNHFFLVLSEDKTILPTLRSRMVFISFANEEGNNVGKDFLHASVPDRMKIVATIVDDKDKESAKRLVQSIVETIHSEKKLQDNAVILKDLMKAEDYLSDRAPSIKMLLEHIALVVPVV